MATYTCFVDGTYKNPPAVKVYSGKVEIMKAKVSFAYQSVAAGDIVQALQVPANSLILKAWAKVTTACTTATRANLGYSSDRDYWGAALPLATTGVKNALSLEASGGLAERSLISDMPLDVTTATTIDLQMTADQGGAAAVTAGVVEVWAIIMRYVQ